MFRISTNVPFVIFLPIFLALFLVIKLPKPLTYTFSPSTKFSFTSLKNDSNVTKTSTLGIPVFSEMYLQYLFFSF
jgi:hypothetical protein